MLVRRLVELLVVLVLIAAFAQPLTPWLSNGFGLALVFGGLAGLMIVFLIIVGIVVGIVIWIRSQAPRPDTWHHD